MKACKRLGEVLSKVCFAPICIGLPHSVLCPARMCSGLGLTAHVDAIYCTCQLPAGSAFCNLGWVVMVFLLLLAV